MPSSALPSGVGVDDEMTPPFQEEGTVGGIDHVQGMVKTLSVGNGNGDANETTTAGTIVGDSSSNDDDDNVNVNHNGNMNYSRSHRTDGIESDDFTLVTANSSEPVPLVSGNLVNSVGSDDVENNYSERSIEPNITDKVYNGNSSINVFGNNSMPIENLYKPNFSESKSKVIDHPADRSKNGGRGNNSLAIENLGRSVRFDESNLDVYKTERISNVEKLENTQASLSARFDNHTYHVGNICKSLKELNTGERLSLNDSVIDLLENIQEDLAKQKEWYERSGQTNFSKSYTSFVVADELLEENETYPSDCYSLIALNGPSPTHWPKKRIPFFLFGFMTFVFQTGFLILMIFSRCDPQSGDVESDNPTDGPLEFIPSSAKVMVRISQVLTIFAYVLFPDSTLMDVYKAYKFYPRTRNSSDPPSGPIRCMKLSCILRGIQGYLATISVFLVVITTTTVVDIILNFAALNFISSLDDQAFSMAKSGVFGESLSLEAGRVEHKTLPTCMKRTAKSRLALYWKVMGSTGLGLLFMVTIVILFQQNPNFWITQEFRLGFQDESLSSLYDGCYEVNRDKPLIHQRRTYKKCNDPSNYSFGYCIDNQTWILFDWDETKFEEPCDATKVQKQIAQSSKTDDFDIAPSFEEPWSSLEDPFTPLDVNFWYERDQELHCDTGLGLGDGKCDDSFNNKGFQFDGGDCCASTCTGQECGRGGNTSVFGALDVDGVGFPTCRDPSMHDITIQLNDFKNSRDFEDNQLCVNENTTFRDTKPGLPSFVLECNGQYVLSILMDEIMNSNTETVQVEDGANCTLRVRNTMSYVEQDSETEGIFERYYFCDAPIWYINYTIFHGSNVAKEGESIEILTQFSGNEEYARFIRIPECYFTKEDLKDKVDTSSFYETSSPVNRAINWLLVDEASHSDCENEFFIERFALSVLKFGMNGNDELINDRLHCYWPGITCNALSQVSQINLPQASLEGAVPSELQLLPSLNNLFLYENQITSIPSTIELMSNLTKLYVHKNNIISIPSEIGTMKNLKDLWLCDNQIESIPSEIGLMENIQSFLVDENRINSIPTEIGSVKTLAWFWAHYNNITFIPSEVGKLTQLSEFWLFNNQIASIPSEIGQMVGLRNLRLNMNEVTSIPTEIGSLTTLKSLWLAHNQIASVPSEIGLMTSLTMLWLGNNQITSFPSEIGLMTNLTELYIGNTYKPSEMRNYKDGKFEKAHPWTNKIASIPSEIGLLTNLTKLELESNYDDLPQEVKELCMPDGPCNCTTSDTLGGSSTQNDEESSNNTRVPPMFETISNVFGDESSDDEESSNSTEVPQIVVEPTSDTSEGDSLEDNEESSNSTEVPPWGWDVSLTSKPFVPP